MTRTLILIVLASIALPAQAQKSYKCVDAKGVTQYTQTPSSICKNKPVEIKGPAPAATPQRAPAVAKSGLLPGQKPSTSTPPELKKHDDIDEEGAARNRLRSADPSAR